MQGHSCIKAAEVTAFCEVTTLKAQRSTVTPTNRSCCIWFCVNTVQEELEQLKHVSKRSTQASSSALQFYSGTKEQTTRTQPDRGVRVVESRNTFIVCAGKGKPELLVFALPERKEEMAVSHCWQKYCVPSTPQRVWLWRKFRSPTAKLSYFSDHWHTIHLARTSEKELQQQFCTPSTLSTWALQAAPIFTGILWLWNHHYTEVKISFR